MSDIPPRFFEAGARVRPAWLIFVAELVEAAGAFWSCFPIIRQPHTPESRKCGNPGALAIRHAAHGPVPDPLYAVESEPVSDMSRATKLADQSGMIIFRVRLHFPVDIDKPNV